jgi:hypothetical protein
VISESEEQFSKQESQRTSTFPGIEIDFNAEQFENADSPNCANSDLDSNMISEFEEHEARPGI